MAFSAVERVQIRRYMGATALYQAYDTRLEQAITAVSDGGAQESEVRDVLLVELLDIDQKLKDCRDPMMVAKADGGDVELDPARAVIVLRSEGRRYVKRLAAILGFDGPRSDAFSPAGGAGRAVASGSHLP